MNSKGKNINNEIKDTLRRKSEELDVISQKLGSIKGVNIQFCQLKLEAIANMYKNVVKILDTLD